MAKTRKQRIGDLGEDIVCRYLENKGFSIIERNYLRPWGELDIVAKKGEKLHFIEVKTVSREALGGFSRERSSGVRPEEQMHPKKTYRLRRVIQTYLLDRRVLDNLMWQFDLACVYLDIDARKALVEVLEDIVF